MGIWQKHIYRYLKNILTLFALCLKHKIKSLIQYIELNQSPK